MVQIAKAAQYRWRLLKEQPAIREKLAQEFGFHPIVAQTLANRNFSDPQEVRTLLQPRLGQLPDPSELPDFEPAMVCLEEAIAARTPILIHGDYDVDGTCGTVLLYRLLRLLNHPVSIFLPDRIRDGYSFGSGSLQAIRERGAKVVIAVDNGTTAIEPLRELHDEGIRVLVVDHHQLGNERPVCTALLNPWCSTPEQPFFPYFCGTGVAYFVAWGLLRRIRGEQKLPESDRRFLIDALGLVALATVGDVMPLRGPNRVFVSQGLRVLGNSSFPGFRALLKQCKVRDTPTETDLGFRIGPRLNAAGRLGQTQVSFDLLSTQDAEYAETLAKQLEGLNQERRGIEQNEMDRLATEVQVHLERGEQALFLGRQDAHFGVLGIVCNRFMEQTGLPTLLWAECQPGLARGSARAPEGHDLMQLLEPARTQLNSFGGHQRAAGFTFDPQHADAIGAAIRNAAGRLGTPEPPTLQVDMEVTPSDLSFFVVGQLQQLGPFGEGHARPRFLCNNMRMAAPLQLLGDGSHAALLLEAQGNTVRVLAWRMAKRLAHLNLGDRVDVVFHPEINSFRGRRSVEWTLEDLREVSS